MSAREELDGAIEDLGTVIRTEVEEIKTVIDGLEARISELMGAVATDFAPEIAKLRSFAEGVANFVTLPVPPEPTTEPTPDA